MTDSVQAAVPVFQGGEEVETTKGRKHITVKTLAQLIDTHGFEILDHLDREAEIPVIDGLQAQGDLFIVPIGESPQGTHAHGSSLTEAYDIRPVPPEGIAVIEAVGGGHEHRLFAGVPGTATFGPANTTVGQDIGVLECTAPAFVAHPEHAYAGIAPGTYVLRRQREQADEERLVAD